MVTTAISRNNIPIRLTDERWAHITDEHGELNGFREQVLETVIEPQRIVEGGKGSCLRFEK